jgi:hypothetical protein
MEMKNKQKTKSMTLSIFEEKILIDLIEAAPKVKTTIFNILQDSSNIRTLSEIEIINRLGMLFSEISNRFSKMESNEAQV